MYKVGLNNKQKEKETFFYEAGCNALFRTGCVAPLYVR